MLSNPHTLDCQPIILKEQPNSGKTIIENFKDLAKVAFAVVLYTACDRGGINDDKAELIEIIQHFCYWLFMKNYTKSKLSLAS